VVVCDRVDDRTAVAARRATAVGLTFVIPSGDFAPPGKSPDRGKCFSTRDPYLVFRS
jgi:hypothetical protein